MVVMKNGGGVLVSVNGEQINGLLHASISTRNCFSADSFAVTFALGPYPLSSLEFWASTLSAYVEIASSDNFGDASQYLITGLVDSVILDPVHKTVAIEGRDLSSSMIDSYRQQDFVNQTASEVVAAIAQGHSLTPIVTATSGAVGRYFGDGYTRLSLGQFSRLRSDWDLVVQLARENSFDVFVEGKALFFQPAAQFVQTLTEISISDVQEMRVERSLGITPTARVQSWNSRNMASVDSDGTGAGGVPAGTNTGSFLFSAANLTASQVGGAADRYSDELSRLRTMLHLGMPWDLSLAPRQNIAISGTDFPPDFIFRIENLDRQYSSTTGSRQLIRAVKLN